MFHEMSTAFGWSGMDTAMGVVLRALLAAATAFILMLLLTPAAIRWLVKRQFAQVIRTVGPEWHRDKSGTPTMGGICMLFAMLASSVLWIDMNNRYFLLAVLTTIAFGLIGFLDDYSKVSRQHSRGLASRWKFFWQCVCGLGIATWLYASASVSAETLLFIPFFRDLSLDIGVALVLFSGLVIVGSSNAVNLTDGLDGLVSLPLVLVAGGLGGIAVLAGHVDLARLVAIPHVPEAAEMAVFCAALTGAGLGFLWFNRYPAQVFMGDIGSLTLGAILGLVAVIVRQEILLAIMGGIFVIEAVSVILQVGSYRLFGRRVFRMAPIHHHFEVKGWHESVVVVRFWILTVLFMLCACAVLFLRMRA